MQPEAELAALRARNEWLEERVAFLDRLLVSVVVLPVEWRLTGSEARLVAALYGRSLCSKDQLMASLYRNDGRDEPEMKIVDVFVCKVRAKIRPYGFDIEPRWGEGYLLSTSTRAAIDRLNGKAAS